MRITQLSVDFSAENDRLRLRIATQDGAELRFWLTRRYVRLLWPALLQLAEVASPVVQQQAAREGGAAAPISPEARKAIVEMEHQEAVQKADFSKPFAPSGSATPLGEEPLLLARVQGGRGPDGKPVLGLHTQDGRGLTLNLDAMLLHAMMRLVHQAAAQAQWDLALALPAPQPPPPSGPLN